MEKNDGVCCTESVSFVMFDNIPLECDIIVARDGRKRKEWQLRKQRDEIEIWNWAVYLLNQENPWVESKKCGGQNDKLF